MNEPKMKTAEEWNKIKESNPLDKDVELIKQIQLDAMKEGMRRAGKEVAKPMAKVPDETTQKYTVILTHALSNAILTAAEHLTISDL